MELRDQIKDILHQVYKARVAYLFAAPAFLLIFVFIAYPLVESLILSLYEWDGISSRYFVGFYNFVMLLTDEVFWLALYNNIKFTLLTTAGTVLIGFLLAVAVERRVKGWFIFKVILTQL